MKPSWPHVGQATLVYTLVLGALVIGYVMTIPDDRYPGLIWVGVAPMIPLAAVGFALKVRFSRLAPALRIRTHRFMASTAAGVATPVVLWLVGAALSVGAALFDSSPDFLFFSGTVGRAALVGVVAGIIVGLALERILAPAAPPMPSVVVKCL